MIALAARTLLDRWQLFVGTIAAVAIGVGIVHAGMTIILGVESAAPPVNAAPEAAEAFRQAASGASTLTGMTVMLGAFLTVFVVASTIGFAVDERRRDLATLRIVGVTAGQIRRVLLGEAALIALLGTLVGAALGLALTPIQRAILTGLGVLPAEIGSPVQPAVLILDLVVAVCVTVLGAWGSVRRATRVRPLEVLRRGETERRVMGVRRWLTAVIAVLLTVVQVYFSATSGGMLIPLLLGLGIVVTASVAMSCLAPLLVPAVAGLVSALAGRRPVTAVAVANLRDAVRRTASCAAPMIVLVSLVMGLQGILDTQTASAEFERSHLIRADLVASGATFDVGRAETIPGIAVAAPETVVPLAVRLTRGGVVLDGPGTVVAVDPDRFRQTRLLQPESGDLADFGSGSIVFGNGLDSLMVNGEYEQITLQVDGTAIPLTEAARMPETLAGTDGFYIDRAILPAQVLERYTTALVQLEPDADVNLVRADLAALGATRIETPTAAAQDDSSTKDRENRGVMGAIVGLGSLYALISVLSTVAISIGQRRSELATLRLSGMTRRQVLGAVVVEALSATLIGLFLGAVAAVTALVGLWIATFRAYGTAVIAVPWPLLLGITALTMALTAATSIVSTRSALRISAIRAVGTPE
ncbi:putative ABC transport system permease protein [Rhodococcus sp. AG1013]|uniref:FtsX-like permease family protein n=1 Tax=Rhodococcus sp. AG1013 TaxID=2183996 RepID=UPI000E0AE31A|nr:ABC transporter permease [Rhodococcus sp. AG1013]RDI23293.1 putative ABC transport system permease protein [Rhodococcus sp. AG1013]